MTPNEIERALLEAIQANEFEGIVSAYLFGSVAEAREHAGSDVDLGLLLERGRYPTPRSRFELKIRLTSRLSSLIGGREVDIVILNDAPPTLARRVVVEGIRVHLVQPELDHAFVRDAQLRAADLEPFLRRMRKIKLDAITRS